ncbi:MAG: DUF4249 family protein [Candidatus Glassbacteria bacterium]
MPRSIIAFLAILALVTASCTENSPPLPEADLVVIRGYLYAGQPVSEIRVTSVMSLGSEDSLAPPISDAQVFLTKNGTRYQLVPTPDRPGYYHYSGIDLTVEAGDRFGIEVTYYGKTATAGTTVPLQPKQVVIDPQELVVTRVDSGGFGQFGRFFEDDTTAVRVDWVNTDGSNYYVTLDNLETDPQPINENFFGNLPEEFQRGFRNRFTSVPVNGSEYRITRQNVTYFGKHLVTVYRVNQEYVDLYRSRNQDTRDLNEPLTNVVNGLGVFTAFNSAGVYLEVVNGQ